jgi:hypothetical protein
MLNCCPARPGSHGGSRPADPANPFAFISASARVSQYSFGLASGSGAPSPGPASRHRSAVSADCDIKTIKARIRDTLFQNTADHDPIALSTLLLFVGEIIAQTSVKKGIFMRNFGGPGSHPGRVFSARGVPGGQNVIDGNCDVGSGPGI